MIHDFEDENEVYDADYHARMRREMIPDGGSVHVPFYLMDSAQREAAGRHSLTDARRADGIRLRDEAHALMVDRMRNPKNYDLNGKRLVNDGVVDDLSDEEIYQLAKRLSGPLCLGVPTNYAYEANEEAPARENSRAAGPSRDNRRAHYPKPIRDRAEALRLRDESYALMVDRMRNPKNYDHSGHRIASSSAR
jgi:hypothetical protein